ncbi:VirD4-like conjugal transfer protein, CD1115 family [Adlercreutzia faecimuris]|uniref:Type IV secretory system conjugative DNA transfer family protein n=1 Tax=Adlercreutzia faecimuris TaxID=2897341 RepID=A0ABS9WGW5_9ACTN|nr:type IV secretory system conjugative DNA transfer family protein [Adlercreutzia sp. JBNU-10]MCI2242103.1 type IV secretory system conjugative DNA transfer family protein [Adlercreutzia sp. JBNU-10]
MRAELSLIAALSAIAFLAGDAAAAVLCAMGNSEGDVASAALSMAQSGTLLSLEPLPLAIGAACACAVWLVWVRWWERRGRYRKGEEHGSARWATQKEMEAFSDRKDADNNILLTEHARIRLIDKTHDQRTETNNNVLVIGGPGTGKTRYFVKPNLMQLNANYFITDPKGTLIHDMGWVLEDAGYEIRTFDTIDFTRSLHFNPIEYIKGEADTLRFVECLIRNTTGDDQHSGDPFWENAEKLLYTALISYLLLHCPEEDHSVPGLLSLLALADAREDDEDYMSPLDMLFHEIETGERLMRVAESSGYDISSREFQPASSGYAWVKVAKPVRPEDDFALASYKQFKVAAGKTLKSIMVSCNVRMKPFDIAEMKELLAYDEMALDHLGDARAKVAVFCSMSDTDSTFDFVFALLMQQALDTLCEAALSRFSGALPRCVHFVFDEFANIGTIPDFERMITVTRSRNIAVSMICQSLSQLDENYGENNAATIMNACDTLLYLGGKSADTNQKIADMIGKQTVANVSVNDSRGANPTYTHNYGLIERDLMQASEVSRMPRDQALVLINGAQAYLDKKYPLDAHPRRESLEAASKRGAFDFKRYRARREGMLMGE